MKFLKYAILAVFLTSCAATTARLSDLDIGIPKYRVKDVMGTPTVRGAIVNKLGQRVEVWEYRLQTTDFPASYQYYWLYIVDGKLAQWGKAGDWSREADNIVEMRFR
jgi:hypothetical protein